MKYSIRRRLGFIKNLTHGLILFSAFILCFAFAKGISNTNMYGNGRGYSEYDGEKDDTIVHQIGDTINIYTSGLDTAYITYAEPIPDSLLENLWVINNPYKQMVVELHHQNAAVNQGIIGVNLTDIFEPNKAAEANNANYSAAPDPWEALSDLAPKTIRVFSGASAKFMHPMGSYDPVDDISYGGYGYNWKEMISYFDLSDDDANAPPDGFGGYHYDDIESQLQDPLCVGCDDWIDSRLTKRFQEFYEKCMDQPTYDADVLTTTETRPLYINELIRLIDKIEGDNPGHIVDVIYCVNIESQSTTELLEVIDYFRDNNVNLIGVEMGNEVANTFGELSMGFSDFDHYWDYINGGNYEGFGGTEEDDLRDALNDDMEDDHDFLEAIKGNSEYYMIKIGLPAMNTPNCGASWGFNLMPPYDPYEEGHTVINTIPPVAEPDTGIEDCECNYPDWNVRMAEFYDEVSSENFYLFDAIVFHPYYTTTNTSVDCLVNSNWRDLMLQLHPDFDIDALEGTEEIAAYLYTPEWEYATVDAALETAFLEISGIPADDLKPGNFKVFVLEGINHSFTEHAHQMSFTDADEGPTIKEIWITEYNIDDEVVLVKPPDEFTEVNTARFKNFEASISNTFAHAVLLQNWFLWNVKMSYDPDYSSNLITRTTIQNFLGGSATMLMTNSQKSDQEGIGEIIDCDATEEDPYFVRRAAYYAVQLWRVIHDNDLHYLKSETTMASLNDNLAPTVFIDLDPLDPKLVIFYSNSTDAEQDIYIHPGDVVEAFEETGYEAILSTDIDAVILDSDQLYSTAGSAAVFKINSQYNTCANTVNNDNYFEITGLDDTYAPNLTCPGAFATASPNGVCVRLPAISMGYFVVPIDIEPLRKGTLQDIYSIYPNPAGTYFIVQQKKVGNENVPNLNIKIYDLYGSLISISNVTEGQIVDISNLPVGAYQVVIEAEGLNRETEALIKMK